jgi:hypothetical protein
MHIPLSPALALLASKGQARRLYALNAEQESGTSAPATQTKAWSSTRTDTADDIRIECAAHEHARGSSDSLIRVPRADVACSSSSCAIQPCSRIGSDSSHRGGKAAGLVP